MDLVSFINTGFGPLLETIRRQTNLKIFFKQWVELTRGGQL
jgi:hypothetical protein